MASDHPDASIVVNVLTVSENGKATYDVENESDVVTRGVASESENEDESEIVVVNMCHHDHENGIWTSPVPRDGQANVSPPCAEIPAETDSAVDSGVVAGAHHE